jgi:hypothetical protein
VVLSVGAAGFGSSGISAARPRVDNRVACAAVDSTYDFLEATSTGSTVQFWEGVEATAQAALHCGSDADL